MPSCVFRGCTNYTGKNKDKSVSFHSIPTDELLKEKWVHIIRVQRREDDWLPTAYSTVCTAHFSKSDIYLTNKNYERIKKTAVPFITKKKEEAPARIVSSPTSLEDVQLSDEESIFESPITAILKAKISKLSLEKRELKSKNNNLERQNKRLKARCIYLKQLVKKLRKKNLQLTYDIISKKAEKDIISVQQQVAR